MAWRLAYSLETLRDQVNAAYLGRSTASDGTIGDAAHAAGPSDHNPNAAGVVCAFDITHDPDHGLDSFALADKLLADRHPDLKYLISNHRIAGAFSGWQWTGYGGSDPHTNHLHVSVGVGDDGQSVQPYDDRVQWNVNGGYMGFNYNSAPSSDEKGVFIVKYRGSPATPAEIDNSSQPWGELNGAMLNEVFITKNKEIDDLKKSNNILQSAVNALRGDPNSEFNLLGRALASLLTSLGYKKG